MTRSLVLIPRDGDRQFLTREQAEELLAGVPDYVEPVAEKPAVDEVVEPSAGKSVVSDKPLVFSPAGSVVFDDPSSYDKPLRSQEWHIASYNLTGRVMACLPDYFAAGLADDKDLIMELRRDLKQGVVCGDRFFSKVNSGYATIVRPYGSTVVKPETATLIIPYYYGETLNNVLYYPDGNVLVRGLFRIDPSLDNDDIANVFLNLTGLSNGKVRLYTPDYNDKPPFLSLKDGFFDIFCDRNIYFTGISHAVSYIPKDGGASK